MADIRCTPPTEFSPRERWLMIQTWRAAREHPGLPMNQWLDTPSPAGAVRDDLLRDAPAPD